MGGLFNDTSAVKNNHIVILVEEAMQHWTKIWADDAIYEKAIALNVQVSLQKHDIFKFHDFLYLICLGCCIFLLSLALTPELFLD
jgi:hypothetical protein